MALTLVQVESGTAASTVASLSATLSSVEAGDIIVGVLDYGNTEPTWTFQASDGSNTYASLISAIGGSGATDIYSFAATAGAPATNLAVVASSPGHVILGLWTVYQYRGASAPTTADCVTNGWTSLQPADTDPVTPAFALVSGGAVIVASAVYIYGASPTLNPITPSAGSYTNDSALTLSSSSQLYCGNVSGAGAQSAETITFTHNPASDEWRATCIAIPIAPSAAAGNTASVLSAETLDVALDGTQLQGARASDDLSLQSRLVADQEQAAHITASSAVQVASTVQQEQGVVAQAHIGPLSSVIPVAQAGHAQAAIIISKINSLVGRGSAAAHSAVHGVVNPVIVSRVSALQRVAATVYSTVGRLASIIFVGTVTRANPASTVAKLPSLVARATLVASNKAQAAPARLRVATRTVMKLEQSLGLTSVAGVLGTIIHFLAVPRSLPASACFYVALPPRAWLAALATQSWLATLPPQTYYVAEGCCHAA